MFKWYRDARVCITYLSDVDSGFSSGLPGYQVTDPGQEESTKVTAPPDGPKATNIFQSTNGDMPSQWFSRGWTLQELLAPRDMYFYDVNWEYLGTKTLLAQEIERITGIDAEYLTGAKNFRKACIATRMSWMAGRTTTRVEDTTYSMLGLFDVTMTVQYGEGQRAFMRLQQELLSAALDESIFAWRMPEPSAGEKQDIERDTGTTWESNEWGLLAPSPDWFRNCGNVRIEGGLPVGRPARSFQMDRQGLQIPSLPIKHYFRYTSLLTLASMTIIGMFPAFYYITRKTRKEYIKGLLFPLNCWVTDTRGAAARLSIRLGTGKSGSSIRRMDCTELPLGYKEGQTAGEGEVIVLQPELRSSD